MEEVETEDVERKEGEKRRRKNGAPTRTEVQAEAIREVMGITIDVGGHGLVQACCQSCGGVRMKWARCEAPESANRERKRQRRRRKAAKEGSVVEVHMEESFATPLPGRFPTQRKPKRRDIDWKTEDDLVKAWLKSSGITIGDMAEMEDQKEVARRILYT